LIISKYGGGPTRWSAEHREESVKNFYQVLRRRIPKDDKKSNEKE